jgi:tRNA modification GTPase
MIDENTIVLWTKADLPGSVSGGVESPFAVSATTGAGIPELLKHLQDEVALRFDVSGAPAITRARHRTALQDCRDGLARALTVDQPELMAEDLRLAARSLGRITGRVGVEDVLDVIFKDFCIGK